MRPRVGVRMRMILKSLKLKQDIALRQCEGKSPAAPYGDWLSAFFAAIIKGQDQVFCLPAAPRQQNTDTVRLSNVRS